jgi:hypothetical protein
MSEEEKASTEIYLPPDYNTIEYAPIELLERGDTDIWLRRRGDILKTKSKETALECEASKIVTLGAVAGAAIMSANPLAWIGLLIAGSGYVYTLFQERQDLGVIHPVPLYRGKLGNIFAFMEGEETERQSSFMDEIAYLSSAEKAEAVLIRGRLSELSRLLKIAPPKARFDLYRYTCDQFYLRQDLITGEEVGQYLTTAVSEARRTAMPPQSQPVIEDGEAKAHAPTPSAQPTVSDGTPSSQPITQPVAAPKLDPTSEQAGIEILSGIVRTRRSTLLIGDTGAGKSVTQAYVLSKLFELQPNTEIFVLAQKADSFCGLAQKGRVILFDPTQPQDALFLIHSIWILYDHRRRLPESERTALPPVRLILADWLSINQSLEEMKNDEVVKASRYLSKLADIIYNGRELNVCLLVDLQSYNLAAVGLKADRNSRKNFNLIGLGNYSIDELGMVNESYGVLTNLIGDRYIVVDESERSALSATFKELQPISKANRRPIIFSGLSPARLALLPDLREYKNSTVVAAAFQPATVTEPIAEIQPVEEAIPDETAELNATPSPTTELKISDSLGEPLKTIWLMAKERADWVTVRDIQRKDKAVLKGKGSEQIHQYLGLLADSGYGEIDEEGKSHSSVRFRAY